MTRRWYAPDRHQDARSGRPRRDPLISADDDLAGVRVLILTTFEIDEYVFAALRAGAGGFLGKGPLIAKTHVNRAIVRLGARDRAQLVVIAYETGLVRVGWTYQDTGSDVTP